eukprot:3933579-Rhodomonas_salina.1
MPKQNASARQQTLFCKSVSRAELDPAVLPGYQRQSLSSTRECLRAGCLMVCIQYACHTVHHACPG